MAGGSCPRRSAFVWTAKELAMRERCTVVWLKSKRRTSDAALKTAGTAM